MLNLVDQLFTGWNPESDPVPHHLGVPDVPSTWQRHKDSGSHTSHCWTTRWSDTSTRDPRSLQGHGRCNVYSTWRNTHLPVQQPSARSNHDWLPQRQSPVVPANNCMISWAFLGCLPDDQVLRFWCLALSSVELMSRMVNCQNSNAQHCLSSIRPSSGAVHYAGTCPARFACTSWDRKGLVCTQQQFGLLPSCALILCWNLRLVTQLLFAANWNEIRMSRCFGDALTPKTVWKLRILDRHKTPQLCTTGHIRV